MTEHTFVVGVLRDASEYVPFADLDQAIEVARANSLQDERVYGVWKGEEDAPLVIVWDGGAWTREDE